MFDRVWDYTKIDRYYDRKSAIVLYGLIKQSDPLFCFFSLYTEIANII